MNVRSDPLRLKPNDAARFVASHDSSAQNRASSKQRHDFGIGERQQSASRRQSSKRRSPFAATLPTDTHNTGGLTMVGQVTGTPTLGVTTERRSTDGNPTIRLRTPRDTLRPASNVIRRGLGSSRPLSAVGSLSTTMPASMEPPGGDESILRPGTTRDPSTTNSANNSDDIMNTQICRTDGSIADGIAEIDVFSANLVGNELATILSPSNNGISSDIDRVISSASLNSLTPTLNKMTADRERAEKNLGLFSKTVTAVEKFKHGIHSPRSQPSENATSDTLSTKPHLTCEGTEAHESPTGMGASSSRGRPIAVTQSDGFGNGSPDKAADEKGTTSPDQQSELPETAPSLQRERGGSSPVRNASRKSTPESGRGRPQSLRPENRESASKSTSPCPSNRSNRSRMSHAPSDESPIRPGGSPEEQRSLRSEKDATCRKSSSKASQEVEEISAEEDDNDDEIDRFLEDLFKEYSGVRDNRGNPLMNNTHMRKFFKDFDVGMPERRVVLADKHYSEEMERQMDMSFRFDLTKAEAKRGLCFKSFCCLLDQVYHRGASRKMARHNFHKYAGDARQMRIALAED
mmetsp:Transcript_50862/g.80635  ORF Transcript_50862/g.80635 Transcript_50862/m.80635 type:complete len:576 (-) Transcript_50862:264-1991(-)|eukprot:CAMPEP_0169151932 /NCGR_PEP_ID=MMETSP1015-20121227/51154_1 /TAXON_ID=342587 /ORGANISM="Karlodinium micrum, Strain CCMP2283" /LENGTH=575 /DNA_ID=CAMNT_0009221513 /DNA_START=32 /DNA_END=1759 /DNA_ORIENTATION=+